jgi:hypothetical protein
VSLGDPYVTAAELKAYLGIGDTVDDTAITNAVNAASRSIEQHCNRQFNQSTGTARSFAAADSYRLDLPGYSDVVSVSALAADEDGDGVFETVWSAADYQLRPINPAGAPETLPYTQIRAVGSRAFPVVGCWPQGLRDNLVQVTGVFGWPAVPAAAKQACYLLAAEIFKLRDAPFGILGMPDLGMMRVNESRRVAALLAPYRRHAVLVA